MDLSSVFAYFAVLAACLTGFTIAVGGNEAGLRRRIDPYRLSMALMSVSVTLTLLRHAAPPFISSILANVMLHVGFALYLECLLRRPPWRATFLWGPVAVMMAVFLYGYYIVPCITTRLYAVHTVHVLGCLVAAFAVMLPGWQRGGRLRLMQMVCAVLFLGCAGLFSLRLWVTASSTSCTDDLLSSPYHALTSVVMAATIVITHFGVVKGEARPHHV